VCLMLRSSVNDELESGALREVAIEDAHLAVPVVLVRRADKRFSALQSALMATIREQLVERYAVSASQRSAAA
jgi:hypothetical protein